MHLLTTKLENFRCSNIVVFVNAYSLIVFIDGTTVNKRKEMVVRSFSEALAIAAQGNGLGLVFRHEVEPFTPLISAVRRK